MSLTSILTRKCVGLGAVLSLAALQFGTAIIAISTLGFLGYGAPPPTPEWGLLIAEGRNYIATSWWLTTLPGIVLVAVVLACCAGAAWWRPRRRVVAGVVAMVAALVAVVGATLGGLVLGSLITVLGAAATLAWTPNPRASQF